jgi:hypothetical protein
VAVDRPRRITSRRLLIGRTGTVLSAFEGGVQLSGVQP